ncbi:uncharacterized protein BDV17DRAFT_284904 [Aspergillus undulatus]|uniref:uncharacterized protein n=1 Tax=Aspergillus undulatus TaxID=1810928 RepID=UPI003CCCDACE
MSSDDTDCTSASTNCHFTCPSGGTWYVCPNEPYFVGCCSSDPCSNSNTTHPCPDVYAASYDATAFSGKIFDRIRPNSCIGESNDNWFTCNFSQPTFLGCCASNPCENDGCPKNDVLAASWSASRNDQFELFQDLEADDTDDGEGGLSGGAIAGIVVGAVAALVIALAGWWFWRRKRRGATGGKIGFTPEGGHGPGHGRSVSEAEGEVQRMYTGEYGYQNPSSPYQDSHFSSPAATVTGTPNPNSKYSSGFSAPSLSPPLPSEGGRPISEISGSDEYHPHGHQRSGSGGQHGLGVIGAQKPPTIQELDDTARPVEVHELDNTSRK